MAFHLSRFNPFSDVQRFDPFRNVENMFKEFEVSPWWQSYEAEPRIKMDIAESESNYTVKAEIPGAKKEDIKVDIDGNQVSIYAETKSEKEEKKGESYLRRECYQGQQYRCFTLAHDVDDTKAEAKYENGVLELTLPKKTGSVSKKLTIQ